MRIKKLNYAQNIPYNFYVAKLSLCCVCIFLTKRFVSKGKKLSGSPSGSRILLLILVPECFVLLLLWMTGLKYR